MKDRKKESSRRKPIASKDLVSGEWYHTSWKDDTEHAEKLVRLSIYSTSLVQYTESITDGTLHFHRTDVLSHEFLSLVAPERTFSVPSERDMLIIRNLTLSDRFGI